MVQDSVSVPGSDPKAIPPHPRPKLQSRVYSVLAARPSTKSNGELALECLTPGQWEALCVPCSRYVRERLHKATEPGGRAAMREGVIGKEMYSNEDGDVGEWYGNW